MPWAAGDGIELVAMDVNDEPSVRAGAAAILEKAGQLDAVANNAGF